MPEAFAVLLVVAVAIGVYFWALIQARNPANHNAQQDLERLRTHEKWLRQRLQRAQQEEWSGDMVERITADLGVTSQQLAKANASAPSH